MAAFLAGKLVREKNRRFERHGWEKRWKFVAKKEKTVERKSWNRWKCKNILSFLNMAEYSQSRGNLNRCDGPFLLNEHGDLYFLLHKNIVHIILLNLEKRFKNLSEGKKDVAGSVRKTVTPTYELWPRKQQLDERFTSTLFKIVWFVPKFYMILFHMLHTFYLSRFFPSVTLTKYVSSYCKI